MSESGQVMPLISLAITSIVQETWKRSGIIKKLARYYYSIARNRIGYINDNEDHYKCFSAAVFEIRRRLFKNDSLPIHLKLDILNTFIDFQKDAFTFGKFLIEGLSGVTEDIAETCINTYVINCKGKIDKQQTIINLAFTLGNVITFISSKHTAYYCVSLMRVKEELATKQRNGSTIRPFSNLFLTRSFRDPESFWLRRLHRDGIEASLFECCSTRGPVEAMEYFLPYLNPEEKLIELSRAAAHVCHKSPDNVEKILFFYKHMEPSTWNTILKRYFYVITVTMSFSCTYRPLIVYFYERVRDSICAKVMNAVLDFIMGFFLGKSNSAPSDKFFDDVQLGDYDSLFFSIWRMIPANIRCRLEKPIAHYINILLYRNRFHLVSSMIANETNKQKQIDLVNYVVMTMLVTNKESYMKDLIVTLCKQPHFIYESVMNNYLSYKSMCDFIIGGDCCANIANYNNLLRRKYAEYEIRCFKHDLLNDNRIINTIVNSIRYRKFTVNSFYQLLMWCFSNNTMLVHHYMKRPANKELLGTVYKNHIISTKTSIYTTNPFCLTDAEMQQIRQFIAKDQIALEEYCANLMASKDFAALPKMLSCVFQDDKSRQAFMTEFFKSRRGYNAVRGMITEMIFDQNLHYNTADLEYKVSQYIQFKKHWILTSEITDAIATILDLYVVPDMESEVEKLDLLPHESLEDFKVICQENWETMQALLTQTEEEFYHFHYGDDYHNEQY